MDARRIARVRVGPVAADTQDGPAVPAADGAGQAAPPA
jgi:hypothetical protein